MNENPRTSTSRNLTLAELGMASAMIAALALAYTGEYVFLRLPGTRIICEQLRLPIGQPYEFLIDYRMALWFFTLAGVTLSFYTAFRFGGNPKGVIVNVVALVAALILAWACWKSNMLPMRLVGEDIQRRIEGPPGP